tara:strand:- start:1436 stop:1675 length:240 start_codon:yes stop_codon:yes gene_type:complete
MKKCVIIQELESRSIEGERVIIERTGWTSKSQFGPFLARMYRKDSDGNSEILFEYGKSEDQAFQNLKDRVLPKKLGRAC